MLCVTTLIENGDAHERRAVRRREYHGLWLPRVMTGGCSSPPPLRDEPSPCRKWTAIVVNGNSNQIGESKEKMRAAA